MKVDDLLTVNNRESSGVVGERGEPEVNNLMYTKKQKHIYAIRKHETTFINVPFHKLVDPSSTFNISGSDCWKPLSPSSSLQLCNIKNRRRQFSMEKFAKVVNL